ncbi:unnamed protein product [Ostreobium quekettii]|uniref:F-box/LRR-repeat protein 15-like leucin rich repeat domain-containing protein n=1 Tax=Ostreobium quekettii TaxID=121088 RepID=A0A8S1JGJ2_9CHLO|nr:unnamed protein product [Ostreobium quekettii]
MDNLSRRASSGQECSRLGGWGDLPHCLLHRVHLMLKLTMAPGRPPSGQRVSHARLSAALKSMRLVNRHWHDLVSRLVRRLSLPWGTEPISGDTIAAISRKFPNVEVLQVGLGLGPADLSSLAAMSRLTSLRFTYPPRGGAECAIRGLANVTRLKELRLAGFGEINESGLRVLTALSRLQRLHLSYGPRERVRDSTQVGALRALRGMPSLTYLRLEAPAAVMNVKWLAALTGIADLDLSGCSLMAMTEGEDDFPTGLAAMERLTRLDLADCNLTGRVMKWALSNMSLTDLNLRRCGFFAEGQLRRLAALTGLARLSLQGCANVGGREALYLSRLAGLRDLDLSYSDVTDGGLQMVAKLPRLGRLSLRACSKVGSPGARYLATIPDLTTLDLSRCPVAIDFISTMTSLTDLSVSGCLATERDMPGLAALSLLARLDLGDCRLVKDCGLQALAGMAALQDLCLARCKGLTDGGMRWLASMPGITRLDLRECPGVTAAGAACLTALPGLVELSLGDCGPGRKGGEAGTDVMSVSGATPRSGAEGMVWGWGN